MAERTTVRLPEELIKRAKRKAAAEGRTLTALIEEGLRLILVGKPKGKAKRVLPPVSDAKGGPWPGIDITDGVRAPGDGRPGICRADETLQMILPDVNVLIYAFREGVPEHAVCRSWLDGVVESDTRFGISPLALAAVVRVTTNLRTYPNA